MRTLFRCPQVRRIGFVVVILTAVVPGLSLRAAPTNTVVAAKADTFVVQSQDVAPAVPLSEFVMPRKPAEGRNPFYPNSTQPYGVEATVKTVVQPSPVAELALKGISGTPEQPLAIINTTTFTAGEENDVMTKAGRMRIRCVEINTTNSTVVVQVGGERRELRLAPKK